MHAQTHMYRQCTCNVHWLYMHASGSLTVTLVNRWQNNAITVLMRFATHTDDSHVRVQLAMRSDRQEHNITERIVTTCAISKHDAQQDPPQMEQAAV